MNEKSSEKSQSQNLSYMLTSPVSSLVIKMAIPSIIGMLILSVYSLVDIYFVSKLGASASAAVGIVFSIMTLVQAMGFMLGTGGGSIISRKLGGGDIEKADKVASVTFFSAIVAGFLVMIFGLVFKTDLMKLLGATDTIIPYAKDFAHYILLASPIMCCSFVLNIMLRSQGKANLSMIGLGSGAILTIILDPIFIFVLKLGISGAAIATFLGQTLSLLVLLALYQRGKKFAKIRFSLFVSSFKEVIPNIIKNGGATFLRQSLVMIANILINIHARPYGDEVLASFSITSRIFVLVISVMFGLGQGFQPVAGFCYGANRLDRVKKAYNFTVIVSFFIQLMLGFSLFYFSSHIMGFFQSNSNVIKTGSEIIRYFALSLPFLPFAVITNMLFQATGQYKQGIFLASCRQGIFFIPLVLVLPRIFGISGLELCQPIANILTAITSIPFAIFFFNKMSKKVKETR